MAETDAELNAARILLERVTPLKTDCGRVCGARCCRSSDGEETGMLLFPGEEEEYRNKPGWSIRKARQGLLLICPGECRREERPLACRLFPLLPLIRNTEIRVRTDQRARGTCPLVKQGLPAFDPAFILAVEEAGTVLAENGKQRAFLERLSEEQDELRELRKRLGGGGSV